MEVWEDVPGFESLYQVSNLGRIKSLSKFVIHKNRRVFFLPEKVLKPYRKKGGYPHVNLFYAPKESKTVDVHRITAIVFVPNPDNKPEVNHVDGNKANCAASNLEWSTSVENKKHAWDNGLYSREKSLEAGRKRGAAVILKNKLRRQNAQQLL